MVSHLAGFSPPLFNAIGAEQLRKAIDSGMTRAASFGLTKRGPVRLYLELMLLLGSRFDTDPQYPWCSELLVGQQPESQMTRADQLFARTRDYRNKVAGTEDSFTLAALRNIRDLAAQRLNVSEDDFTSDVLNEIWRIYPRKADYLGSDSLKALIERGLEEARHNEFSGLRDRTLVIILMLMCGHGCFDDPLFPWIAHTMNDERVVDAAARAKRLEAKALTWLEHVLKNLGQGVPA